MRGLTSAPGRRSGLPAGEAAGRAGLLADHSGPSWSRSPASGQTAAASPATDGVAQADQTESEAADGRRRATSRRRRPPTCRTTSSHDHRGDREDDRPDGGGLHAVDVERGDLGLLDEVRPLRWMSRSGHASRRQPASSGRSHRQGNPHARMQPMVTKSPKAAHTRPPRGAADRRAGQLLRHHRARFDDRPGDPRWDRHLLHDGLHHRPQPADHRHRARQCRQPGRWPAVPRRRRRR